MDVGADRVWRDVPRSLDVRELVLYIQKILSTSSVPDDRAGEVEREACERLRRRRE